MNLRESLGKSLPVLFLIALGLLVLAPHVPWAGLHLDDHGFHWVLSRATWQTAWGNAQTYTPGRNLYILYYWAFYKVLGPDPSRLHLLGLGLDILNSLLAYALLRRTSAGRAAALLISGLFLVWPNHAETHFWTSAVGMNLLSTTFILLSFLAAGSRRLPESPRMVLAVLLFGLALFDYDQAFFMWIPLLYHLNSLEERPSKASLAGLAGTCLAMCAGHFLIRIFTPYPGGSPTVRLSAVALRVAESLVVSAVPLMKFPLWEGLASFAGGPLPTIALVLVLAGCWLGLGVRLWTDSDAVPMDRLAVLGALWFAAAYLPNYFWYISPRHNYLPSLGALMIAFYLTSRLLARWRALRPAAAAAAFLLFGLSASATLAEGQGWKRASGLHSRFMAEAPALLPDGPDGIFLAGMPRTVLRAPAFSLTDEHLYLYAYATGRLLRAGDVTITPARFGVFYRNQPSVYGPANLYWHPYKGLAVLSGGAGGSGEFTRPQRLRIEPPDLPAEDITLCGLAVCRGALAIPARVWLLSAKLRGAAAPKAPLFEAANGVSLAALSAARDPRWVEVEFVWKADRRPAADFATVIRLHDAAGALIFEPVYRSLTEPGLRSDKGLAVLWPAFNDLLPASTWKAGSAVAERFRLTLPKPLPAGPLEARLTLFEKVEGGPWKNLGEFKAALP